MEEQISLLEKYTDLAKSIIYDPKYDSKFKGMMETEDGAIVAVNTVLGAINQSKHPVPPELARNLAVNTYMVLVDLVQGATGIKASNKVLNRVIGKLLVEATQTHSGQQQATPQEQPQQQPPQQGGILSQGAM